MFTFSIDADNNITALAGLPVDAHQSQSFSNTKELANLTSEWPVARLVETWNSFAGVAPFDDLKPVKKFTSRKAAVARIWEAVQRLAPTLRNARRRARKGKAKKSPTKATRRAGRRRARRVADQQEGRGHRADEARQRHDVRRDGGD